VSKAGDSVGSPFSRIWVEVPGGGELLNGEIFYPINEAHNADAHSRKHIYKNL